MPAPIINRCLKPEQMERMVDLGFLVKTVRASDGELDLSFRDNRFTIYFAGNVLATVAFRPNGLYRIDFQQKFLGKTKIEMDSRVNLTPRGQYPYQDCDAKMAHVLLQQRNVGQLMRGIREVNNGEEITYEQFIMGDTPPTKKFFIIDRQVTDRVLRLKRMDLLGLKRLGDGTYGFAVIEIKLGKNAELSGKVADQLQFYVDHLSNPDALEAYATCYEEVYRQKRKLGLYPDKMPKRITVARTAPEGLIVSCGYARKAKKQIKELLREHPSLQTIQMDNNLANHL